jgi:preprotein translocase subunit YajC
MSLHETAGFVLAQAGDSGSLMGLLPIILMFVILYFLMIRPQMKRQKEHKALVAALAKGDEVISAGGMLGKVTKVNDSYITVEVSELADKPVEVLLQRTAVQMVLPKGTIKQI